VDRERLAVPQQPAGDEMNRPLDPRAHTMRNGKHFGKPMADVPSGYLRWMVENGHSDAKWAQAEIDRRAAAATGTTSIEGTE
jgi:hypothetical protein